jgi:adenylate cyclase
LFAIQTRHILPLFAVGFFGWATDVLQLRLFGQPAAWQDNLTIDISGKFSALLAVLANADRSQLNRHQIASLLWAEMDDERARHNLRQLVARVRKSQLQPAFYITEDTISLRKDQLNCDAWTFLHLSSATTIPDLEQALALYRGTFCAGVEFADGALVEWLDTRRSEFKERMIETAVRLSALNFEAGHFESAMKCAERAIAEDNLREDAHRLVMQSLEALGRRGEAIRRYDTLTKLLEDELDAEPDELTQLLAVGLKQESTVNAANAIGGTLSARDRFLDKLALEAAAPSTAAVLVIKLDQEGSTSDQRPQTGAIREYAAKFGAVAVGGNESRIDLYVSSTQIAARLSLELMTLSSAHCLRAGLHITDASAPDSVDPRQISIAYQLSKLARSGQFLLSVAAREQLVSSLDGEFVDQGAQPVASDARQMRYFEMRNTPEPTRAQQHVSKAVDIRPTIAIVPLVTLTNDPNLSMLGQIVAEEMIGSVSRLSELAVISRLSTTALTSRQLSAVNAHELIGADYMIGGACSISGTQARLNVEFSDCRTMQVQWVESVACPVAALLADGGQIDVLVQRIVATVLRREFDLSRQTPFERISDCTLHLGAVTLMHQLSPTQFDLSAKMLSTLVERAPYAAVPHAWLAFHSLLRVSQGWSTDPGKDAQFASECCQRALDIDPTNSIALAVDGHVHTQFKKDFEGAHRRFEAALESNPNNSLAWLFKATLHGFQMQREPALEASRNALKLSPLDPRRWLYDSLCATAALGVSDYETAIALGKRSLHGNAAHVSTYRALAIAQALSGQMEGARKTASILMRLQPDLTATKYRERHPSGEGRLSTEWAEALRLAGVPA